MADDNILAVIVPLNYHARNAISRPQNKGFFTPRSDERWEVASIDQLPATTVDFAKYDRITLRFDQNLKNANKGWVFGCDARICDVYLHADKGYSHGSETFQMYIREDKSIFVKGISNRAITVTLDAQTLTARAKSTWMIAGPPAALKSTLSGLWDSVIVEIKSMQFRIFTPNQYRGTVSKTYLDNMQSFYDRCQQCSPAAELHSLTMEPTAPDTHSFEAVSKNHHIYDVPGKTLKKSRGVFVRWVVSVSEGQLYVAKTFERNDMTHIRRRNLGFDWPRDLLARVNALHRIKHPNIVPIRDFWLAPDHTILMEGYQQSLQEYIETLPATGCSSRIAASILRQLLSALEVLHFNDIVHRDIKPMNVFVKARGAHPPLVVLGDFGGAAMGADVPMTSICGTPGFAPPEIVVGKTPYNNTVDSWSLAVTMLTLLSPDLWEGVPADGSDHERNEIWFEHLQDEAEELGGREGFEKVATVLEPMLKMFPVDRCTASQCLQIGCDARIWRRKSLGFYEAYDDELET